MMTGPNSYFHDFHPHVKPSLTSPAFTLVRSVVLLLSFSILTILCCWNWNYFGLPYRARCESLAARVVVWLFDSPLVLPLGISSASEEINHLWCDLCGLSLFNSFSVLFVYFLLFIAFYWTSSTLWPPVFFPDFPASGLPRAAAPTPAFAFVS